MRAYYLPFVAGALLVVSAFLPWVVIGGVGVGGVPAASALWILALGVAAMILASLSVMTRKNSRHPLLLIGDRKSTRLNSSHSQISYAVFCLKKKKKIIV